MIEFTYKGNTYYTSNIKKKLKRLKISEDDIVIVREFEETKKQVQDNTEYDDVKIKITFWDPLTNMSHIGFSHTHKKPTVHEFFKNCIWNEETKCGIRECNEEFLNRVKLLDGIPKYPIVIGEDSLPELEVRYNW